MHNLHEVLADGIRFDPNYRPSGNSDHLPMTLCAMAGLGGDIATSLVYRVDYQKILHDIEPQAALADWRDGLGQREAYPALLSWCLAEVRSQGIAATVALLLPQLISSLVVQAFHPLIRLGYAIDFDSPEEVAAALAYWISTHQPIPLDVTAELDLQDALQQQVLHREALGATSFDSEFFGRRVGEQVRHGSYPLGKAVDLAECARVGLDVYCATRDFFALHLVTACQALRQCLPYVDQASAVAALTGAFLAAHRALDCPAFARDQPLPVPAQIDREHGYKFVWACLSEYRAYGDERYVQEIRAWRDAGLVPAWCAVVEV